MAYHRSAAVRRTARVSRLVVILAVALLFVALAVPGAAQAQVCAQTHTVRAGENLYRIGLAYGVPWTTLAAYNGLTNPNLVFVGRALCIPPGGTVPTTPPPYTPGPGVPTVPGGAYYPPPGVFPYITFNTRTAQIGQTITIFGYQFPGGSTVDIFIAPRIPFGGTVYPATASGSATVNADGTLVTAFVIPANVAGVPLTGTSYSILVRARGSGFFGFNYVNAF